MIKIIQDVNVKLNPGLQAKAAFNKKTTPFASKFDLNFRKKLFACYVLSIAFYGVEIWTLREVDHKYLESSEVLCWRRLAIGWTNHVRNEVFTKSQGGQGYSTESKKEGKLTGLVTSCVGTVT